MKVIQDEAIVLRKRQLKEKDELITVLTKYHGKMLFVVPGSRDPRSKKAGILEPTNTISFQVRESKSKFPYLNQVKLVKSRGFGIVAEDESLGEFYRALEMLRLIDKNVQEEQDVHNLFSFLSHALDAVSVPLSVLWFQIQFFDFLGFLPDFKRCVHCHLKPDSSSLLSFCAEHRGFAHQKCLSMNTESVQNSTVSIEFDVVKTFAFLQTTSLQDSLVLDLSLGQVDSMMNLFKNIRLEH